MHVIIWAYFCQVIWQLQYIYMQAIFTWKCLPEMWTWPLSGSGSSGHSFSGLNDILLQPRDITLHWHLVRLTSRDIAWHVTCDMWHVTILTWCMTSRTGRHTDTASAWLHGVTIPPVILFFLTSYLIHAVQYSTGAQNQLHNCPPYWTVQYSCTEPGDPVL